MRELLRVENGRYWSYLCGNVDCCPPEGTPFDYPSNPVAAAMTVAGLAAYPDRAALVSTLAPVTGEAAQAMDRAIERAYAQEQALVDQAQREGPGDPLRIAISEGRCAVREAIAPTAAAARITDADAFARLVVGLVNLPVRDDAWARMVPEHREAHLRLWADIVRRASGLWLPAPASLLAFTAWQAGDGTLANVALDRALAADPDYSMARLLRDILAAGSAAVAGTAADDPRRGRSQLRTGRVAAGDAESAEGAGRPAAQACAQVAARPVTVARRLHRLIGRPQAR